MNRRKSYWLFVLSSLNVFAASPVIFFTDLDSGPNAGGENRNGAYVRIYGRNFGSAQGNSSVAFGGGSVIVTRWEDVIMSTDRYLEVLTVQLTSTSASGPVVVTVGGVASNSDVTFTVRSGNIYCVSTSGLNTNSGTFSGGCWADLLHARDNMSPGDITYAEDGVCQCVDDGLGWSTSFLLSSNSGTAGKPKAISAYPGATATIGSLTSNRLFGIRSQGNGNHYWTFAGLTLAGSPAFQWYSDHNWRMIGNVVTCPAMNGQVGCADLASSQPGSTPAHDNVVWGNLIYNVGTNYAQSSVTALQHGVYVSQLNYNLDFGWNTIKSIHGCRGLQVNSNNNGGDVNSGGSYSLQIHDNVVHDTPCDGMIIATVNPNAGPVLIYNNIIYNVGIGPDNAEASGSWTCIDAMGWIPGTPAQYSEGGTIQIYNNTMYACGTFSSPPYKDVSGGILWEAGEYSDGTPVTTKSVNLVNNIIYLTTGPASGYQYFQVYQPTTSYCTSACSEVTGSNNIFYVVGSSVSNTMIMASTFSDPKFVNTTTPDFHLQVGSPAATGGLTTSQSHDFDGTPLSKSGGYPIGALAVTGGGTVIRRPPRRHSF